MASDLDWLRDQFYWRALSERDGVVDPDDFDQIKADWRRAVRGIEASPAFDRLCDWIRERDGGSSGKVLFDRDEHLPNNQNRFLGARIALTSELASLKAAARADME